MIERIGRPLTFTAFFTSLKQGKTGLSVTVDVFDPTGTKVVAAASGAEIGDGLYSYAMSGTFNTVAGNYAAVFKTSDGTVDFQWVPALWTVGEQWVQNLVPLSVRDSAQGTPTATTIQGSSALSATDNFYLRCFVVFTTGVLTGIPREVTAYVGATKTLTTVAFPTPPSGGDQFAIIGQGA